MILDTIVYWDTQVLNFIQQYLAPESLKPFIKFFSYKESILYLAIPAIPYLLYKNWKRTIGFFAILALSILLTDQTAYHLKKNVHRVRPMQADFPVARQTQTNSFPSAHAANLTGAFFVICYFWPRFRYPMVAIWFFVCYGRLFLNKHYPTDVLTGCLFGLLYAQFLIKWFVPFLLKRFEKLNAFTPQTHKVEMS